MPSLAEEQPSLYQVTRRSLNIRLYHSECPYVSQDQSTICKHVGGHMPGELETYL
jgi:hypothetical protein